MDTKLCPRCECDLPVDQYTKSSSRKDGLQPYCIECARAYRREHYYSNKEQYYERNKKQEEKLKRWVHQYKVKRSCVDCDIRYPEEPWLMEFDHLEEEEKDMNISALYKYGSLKRVKKEITKCDLLCVVCHRRRSADRGDWEVYD